MRLEDFSSPTQQKNLSSSPQKARVLHIFHRLWGQFSVHVYLPSCLAVSSWTKHKSPQLQRCFWNFWDAQTLTNLKFRWSLVRCIFWLNNRCSIWFQSLCWMKHPNWKSWLMNPWCGFAVCTHKRGPGSAFLITLKAFLPFFCQLVLHDGNQRDTHRSRKVFVTTDGLRDFHDFIIQFQSQGFCSFHSHSASEGWGVDFLETVEGTPSTGS